MSFSHSSPFTSITKVKFKFSPFELAFTYHVKAAYSDRKNSRQMMAVFS
jgi:hypothetical protein